MHHVYHNFSLVLSMNQNASLHIKVGVVDGTFIGKVKSFLNVFPRGEANLVVIAQPRNLEVSKHFYYENLAFHPILEKSCMETNKRHYKNKQEATTMGKPKERGRKVQARGQIKWGRYAKPNY